MPALPTRNGHKFTAPDRTAVSSIRTGTFHPDTGGRFTAGGRTGSTRGRKNAGWRIDYFLRIGGAQRTDLQDAKIHTEVTGSDHCPVKLDIEL